MLRKSACQVWRCVSTRPGRTRQSVASITSASLASIAGATVDDRAVLDQHVALLEVAERRVDRDTVPPLISVRAFTSRSGSGGGAAPVKSCADPLPSTSLPSTRSAPRT